MDLTPDQINQLQSLGINVSQSSPNPSNDTPSTTPIPVPETKQQTISSSQPESLLTKKSNPIVPILSLSGLTLISFGGLILFKTKSDSQLTPSPPLPPSNSQSLVEPTQVPKSIQHYLLTSQQFFTSALQAQNSQTNNSANLLNQSILAASAAIQEYPTDYRGYEQRARIYQSLIDSQPSLITQAVADLARAHQLNPSSAEITRNLATLYAKTGDVQNTLNYLTQTITLEPTRAQNFYDLARIQTQAGYVSQALDTYNRLLTLVSDPTQKTQVETEKASLEKLISQNPTAAAKNSPQNPTPTIPLSQGPMIQASLPDPQGLIIAAPETSKDLTVTSLTDTNSLSGTATLPPNTPSITITNTNLTSSSQVYLTITKGGKNQSLQVLSKSTGSFTAGLDSPVSEEIVFRWWIINQ